MKKVLNTIIGSAIVIAGGTLTVTSSYQTLRGKFIWVSVIFVGVVLVLSGISIAKGARIRDVIWDLLK
jgi:hypothetical protein